MFLEKPYADVLDLFVEATGASFLNMRQNASCLVDYFAALPKTENMVSRSRQGLTTALISCTSHLHHSLGIATFIRKS